MKKLIALLAILFSTYSVHYAQPYYVHWTKFIGGQLGDETNHAIQTTDSSIVFVGSTSDTLGNGDIPASQSDSFNSVPQNLLIGKLDSNKQIAWIKVYGGSRADQGRKVLLLQDGTFIVLANTYSYDGDVTGLKGASDVWLLHLDDQGDLLWQKTYGSSESDIPIDIKQTADNGFIILAASNGADGDVPFHYGGFFELDWVLIKTDSTGNVQWSKTIGGEGDEAWSGSVFELNGFYYISSPTTSSNHDCNDSSWRSGPHSDNDFYLIKLDNTGNVLWSKSYGGSQQDRSYFAMIDERDYSIVITGYTQSTDYMVQNNYNNFYRSIWIVKTDTNGNYIWGRRLGDTVSDNQAHNILPHDNGGYLLGATAFAGSQLQQGHIGGQDSWIFMLDSSGNSYYDKIFGGTLQETPSTSPTLLHFKSGLAVCGTSLSSHFTEGTNLNNNHSMATDVFVSVLFDFPDPLAVINRASKQGKLIIYPNPSKERVRFVFPDGNSGTLTISDNSGKVVYNRKFKGEKEADVETAGWAKGIYIAQWISVEGLQCRAKLINN